MHHYSSGDLCQFGSMPGEVIHYRCDDYRDGTITNCITGQVIKKAPYTAPMGFRRG